MTGGCRWCWLMVLLLVATGFPTMATAADHVTLKQAMTSALIVDSGQFYVTLLIHVHYTQQLT